MTPRPCCALHKDTPKARIAGGDPRGATPKHGRGLAGMIFPSAALVLLPKCPACIAAYVAMGTGFGLTLTAAMYVRMGIVSLCVIALAYFAVRCVVHPLIEHRGELGTQFLQRVTSLLVPQRYLSQSVSKRCSFQGSPYMW